MTTSTLVLYETPQDTGDGTHENFSLQNEPNPASSLVLILDGVRLQWGNDYQIGGVIINLIFPKGANDYLLAFYTYDA